MTAPEQPTRDVIPLREATKAWFAISLQTFGGPAGQIAVMQRTLVEEKRWIGQQRFLFALSYCTLLPGPEAQQLATYVGWLLNGVRGALVAGILFVLPGVVALLVLSGVYVGYGDTTLVESLFLGLAPAVIAIVVQAVVRVGRKGLGHPALVGLAVASVRRPDVLRRAVPGRRAGRRRSRAGSLGRQLPALTRPPQAAVDDGPPPLISDDALHAERPSGRRAALTLAIGLVAVVRAGRRRWQRSFGRSSIFVDQGLFFSGAALVTFGGAYAVLAYVAQQAVEVYGWLAPGEMVRGLALAETTPGPLIMVVQFVAFVGAYRAPGDLDPWVAAVVGRAADDLGDVRAVLPLHPARGAVRRAPPRQPRPRRRADRHHRRRRRCHREPRGLLRPAHALRRHPTLTTGPLDVEYPVLASLDSRRSPSPPSASRSSSGAGGRCSAPSAPARSPGSCSASRSRSDLGRPQSSGRLVESLTSGTTSAIESTTCVGR